MNKFYTVKKGRMPGIYTSWLECEKNVKGFSGAIYKSFQNKIDAELFLNSKMVSVPVVSVPNTTALLKNKIIIYTDGSHKKHSTNNYVGYGAYCSYLGKEYKLSGNCNEKILKEYGIDPKTNISNPTCEFIAFAEVLKIVPKIDRIIFKIDYIGVKNWMAGTWKCKAPHIKKIKEKCDFLISKLSSKILIEYVPAHTGNKGNEEADKLAKNEDNFNTFIF